MGPYCSHLTMLPFEKSSKQFDSLGASPFDIQLQHGKQNFQVRAKELDQAFKESFSKSPPFFHRT